MIYFIEKDNVLFVRAEGHITAQQCPKVKDLIFSRLETDPPVEHIYIDLNLCTYMDSTFLGLLAGFNRKLKMTSHTMVEIQNVNEDCRELLKSTGLNRIMSINENSVEFPSDMASMQTEKSLSASMILHAHEDLIDISDENKARFSTLHSILSQQAHCK